MARLRRHFGRAFTLVEALLASVILAMAITAILMPFTAGAQNEQADARSTLAVALAQELMEEILSKPFRDPQGDTEPGPDGDERRGRSYFDNMDDYHGYAEEEWGILALDGTRVTDPAAAGLTRRVTATYVYVAGQDVSEAPTFLRITVDVRYSGQPLVSLTRLVYDTSQ